MYNEKLNKNASPPQMDGAVVLPGGANVPSHVGTWAPPAEYN